MARHPNQKCIEMRGPSFSAIDEIYEEVNDLLTTRLTERDRIELEQGTASRHFALRQEERWGRL